MSDPGMQLMMEVAQAVARRPSGDRTVLELAKQVNAASCFREADARLMRAVPGAKNWLEALNVLEALAGRTPEAVRMMLAEVRK